ncbi:Leucine rich repeat containing protein BspA family protein [Entamoeba marina]
MDNNTKQLDSYSMLIVSKYFKKPQDYINIICVCKKFKETTEKLRFNPIPITSLKLFPKIQTQYLYSKKNKWIKGIKLHEICYEIDYKQYLRYKENNVKCYHVNYTKQNRENSKNYLIPKGVNILGHSCFNCCNLKQITIPNYITSIKPNCFWSCQALEDVVLSSGLTSIAKYCFSYCESLTSISVPQSIQSMQDSCFYNCSSLQTINIPDSVTSIDNFSFSSCTSLQSIALSSSLQTLPYGLFNNCFSLTKIEIPPKLTSIGGICFSNCYNLISVTFPTSIVSFGYKCFQNCKCCQSILNLPDVCL